jgi:glucose-1-phosphate adenylyltransferase
VVAYDFHDLNMKAASYWRDVGTLDAYYEANIDLVNVNPEFNLYDRNWPVRTRPQQNPPAKFVFAQEGRRMGIAIDSIVSSGCIVSGGRVTRSVLSPGVRINSFCEVQDSILLHNAQVGRCSRIRRAIIDTNTIIPDWSVIGFDLEDDRAKGHHVTESGIVIVPLPDTVYGESERRFTKPVSARQPASGRAAPRPVAKETAEPAPRLQKRRAPAF